MAGIEATKAALHGVVGVIIGGIKIAKQFNAVVPELGELDFTEIVALITQVATTEVPAIVAAIKE
jgi:hypothetical protein